MSQHDTFSSGSFSNMLSSCRTVLDIIKSPTLSNMLSVASWNEWSRVPILSNILLHFIAGDIVIMPLLSEINLKCLASPLYPMHIVLSMTDNGELKASFCDAAEANPTPKARCLLVFVAFSCSVKPAAYLSFCSVSCLCHGPQAHRSKPVAEMFEKQFYDVTKTMHKRCKN